MDGILSWERAWRWSTRWIKISPSWCQHSRTSGMSRPRFPSVCTTSSLSRGMSTTSCQSALFQVPIRWIRKMSRKWVELVMAPALGWVWNTSFGVTRFQRKLSNQVSLKTHFWGLIHLFTTRSDPPMIVPGSPWPPCMGLSKSFEADELPKNVRARSTFFKHYRRLDRCQNSAYSTHFSGIACVLPGFFIPTDLRIIVCGIVCRTPSFSAQHLSLMCFKYNLIYGLKLGLLGHLLRVL